MVDVDADACNRGADLGVDEGVLEQDASDFQGTDVDVVGPFDGDGPMWQAVFHKIENCERSGDVQLELFSCRKEFWIENDAEAEVLVRF